MKFLFIKKKQVLFCLNSNLVPARIKTNIKQTMRVSAAIIFLTGFCTLSLLAASGKAQKMEDFKISITIKNELLTSVLRKIEAAAPFHFVYPSSKIGNQQVQSFSVKNLSVAEVLKKLLLPRQLTFKAIGDNILIDKLKKSAGDKAMSAIIRVEGRILDETGQPLPGVTVRIKDSQRSTATDNQGNYRIDADETDILIFTFVGYQTLQQPVNGRKRIDVALIPVSGQMKEVVVIGYGTQSRKDVTTSVASLGSDQINNYPATGVDQALTGKLAGVQVLQPNGAPGAGIAIKVRGTGTITAGSSPLYVIDGVPLSDNDINGPGFRVNPLNAINVNDIESVDVLKDASAAAIYGSRGSNGVVMITTKKGKKDQLAISLNSYYGVQSATKKIPMLDAYGYAQLIYDAHNATYFDQLASKGLTGNATDDNATRLNKLGAAASNTSLAYLLPPEIFPYLQGQQGLTNTDWQDAIFQRAPMQSHTLSASGGSGNIQYYISGNYLDQNGIVVNSGYKRYGGRVNLDAQFNRLRMGVNLNYNYGIYNYGIYNYLPTEGRFNDGNENIIETALIAAPFFPVKNADGSYNYDQYKWQWSQSNGVNPVALAELKNDVTYEKKLLSNIYAEYEFTKDLKFRTSFGVNISDFNRSTFRPSTLPYALTLSTPSVPTASYVGNQIANWVAENTLSYKKRFGDHSLQFLGGFTLQKERANASSLSATGFPNDLVQTVNGATSITSFSGGVNEWSLLSGLGRVQYSFKDRYLLSAAIRADGSSRFGANTKYGYFPSASAGWIISDEDFMKDIPVVSNLKLRASYGVTGNFQIGNYAYLSTLSQSNYIFGSGSGTLNPGLNQSTPGNPDLGWEKTSAFNLGTDIGLFQGILNATVDVYSNKTSNLLLNVPVPLSTGYSTNLVNIGKVSNKGIEVTLSNNSQIGKLKITNTINYSANRNKVLDLGGVNSIISQAQSVIYFITQVGQPIGNYYTLHQTGIYKDQADIDNTSGKVPGAKPGDFKFEDVNGDKIIDNNDRTITGNYQPKFTYGYSGQLQYGIFDLNVAAQGVYGNTIANVGQRHYNATESYSNNTTDALNRWVSPSDPGNGIVGRANRSQTGLNAQISTYHLSPGSYFRIRDLTLGVSLPERMVKSAGIAGVRLYFTAQNPFTFTKYNGYNPEVSVDSNPLFQGIDYGSYPVTKSFLLGVNLKF